MPRKRIGSDLLTLAERQRRHRAKRKAEAVSLRDALVRMRETRSRRERIEIVDEVLKGKDET